MLSEGGNWFDWTLLRLLWLLVNYPLTGSTVVAVTVALLFWLPVSLKRWKRRQRQAAAGGVGVVTRSETEPDVR
jgi:hypothetical protein